MFKYKIEAFGFKLPAVLVGYFAAVTLFILIIKTGINPFDLIPSLDTSSRSEYDPHHPVGSAAGYLMLIIIALCAWLYRVVAAEISNL